MLKKSISFRSLLAAFAFIPALLSAREVSPSEAAVAARNWLRRSPAPLGARLAPLSSGAPSVRTAKDDAGRPLFHLVQVDGGTVVVSADDRLTPVIALTEGEVVESDEDPLWALLQAGMASRMAALRRSGVVAAAPAAAPTKAQAAWASLTGSPSALSGPRPLAPAIASPSDVRVAPLLTTKWDQGDLVGTSYHYFNHLTPNNYLVGCSPTAMGQVMKYHRHPTEAVAQATFECTVDGVARSMTLKGGLYDWDAMLDDPSGAQKSQAMGDDRHREATGKLLHDLAVAYRTDWTASGAAAWLPMITSVMTRNFHYASAVTYVSNGPVPDAISAQLLRSNLDAGLPVVLDIGSTTEAHSVVGDGYGYEGGALYIHVNMGWSGRHDAWYNMPDIDTPQIPGATFQVAHYNISPDKRGALLTGRVTDPLGAPVAGASVTAASGGRTFSGTSNAKGIYALWVKGDETYGVTATSGGHSASIGGVLVPAPKTENFASSASPYNSRPGNSAGNDIAFAAYTSLAVTGADEVTGGQTATYTATAGYADGSSAVVSAAWAITAGSEYATISSDGLLTAKAVTADAQVTISAVFDGKTATKTVSIIAPAPANDAFANAISLPGDSGTAEGRNTRATKEAGEPDHAGRADATETVWWRWEAPSVGTATFTTAGSSFDTVVGVYTGEVVSALTEVASDDDGAAGAGGASRCSFRAEKGVVYSIAVAGKGTPSAGTIRLGYSFDPIALVSCAITGPSSLAPGASATYRCEARYDDGTTVLVTPAWSIAPPVTFATLSAAGLLEIAAWTADGTVTLRSEYEGTVATKTVSVVNPSPANDAFANAFVLSGPSGETSGWNYKATTESGEPGHGGLPAPSASVWWRWTAPGSGWTVFSVDGDAAGAVISIYEGTDVSALTEVASAADGATCSFMARGGTVYHIAVDRSGGGTPALFRLAYDHDRPHVRVFPVRQRYPWSGLVDIDYEVSGVTNVTGLSVRIEATTESTNLVLTALDPAPSVANGTHRVTWDPSAQGVALASTNVVYTVTILQPAQYMVIDLSGGASATAYPVSYLTAVPEGGWTYEYKTTNLVMRRIPAGTFTMGSPGNELGRKDNEMQHEVTLTDGFYMGVFEVTQKQWELVMGANPSSFTGAARPVEQVSYDIIRGASAGAGWPGSATVDADSFLGKLRAKTGIEAFDLPTEAQWEYACRAGTTTSLNSGKDITTAEWDGSCPHLAEVGRYDSNNSDGKGGYGEHTTVGSYKPNAFALYDMHGNVFEWCLDWFTSDLGANAVTNPVGEESGSFRVLHGGSWNNEPRNCRSAVRNGIVPSYEDYARGFRLSRTVRDGRNTGPASQTGSAPVVVLAQGASAPSALRTWTEPLLIAPGGVLELPYSDRWDGTPGGESTLAVDGQAIGPFTGEGVYRWNVPNAITNATLSLVADGRTNTVPVRIWEPVIQLIYTMDGTVTLVTNGVPAGLFCELDALSDSMQGSIHVPLGSDVELRIVSNAGYKSRAEIDPTFDYVPSNTTIRLPPLEEDVSILVPFLPDLRPTLRWKLAKSTGLYYAQIAFQWHDGYEDWIFGPSFLFEDRVDREGNIVAQLRNGRDAARPMAGGLFRSALFTYSNRLDGYRDGERVVFGVSDATLADPLPVVPVEERKVGLYVRKRVDPAEGNEIRAGVNDFLGYLGYLAAPLLSLEQVPVIARPSSVGSLSVSRPVTLAALNTASALALAPDDVADDPAPRLKLTAFELDGAAGKGTFELTAASHQGGRIRATSAAPSAVRLETAESPAGPWRAVEGAVFDGASGFTLPPDARPGAFYRLVFEPGETYQ